ncbi:TIGR02677 family protein [Planotetraspora sp. A-T 1434]|uniref:TIGR02677 family protein n=1 Tax=Planotetraspora sp. A-T 1434 TaxID=2979219 RepID=UPI0021BFDDEF|nr:TIGR02677 family protein [Planotetraspora sp. A-T 1434]MCT9934526.1 TIGR02677 family protein [Planotetraspora sp. A-T 1434]
MSQLHGFGHQMPIVTYLTGSYAVFYRLVLDVLLEEESRLGIHLSTAEIDQRVRAKLAEAPQLVAELPSMDGLLESLYGWRNVDRIYNMRRSGSAQEFLHKDFLYQLTSAGAQVHRMLMAIDQEMGTAGSLQASTLPEVLDALRALARAAEEKPADLAGCARAFQRLVRGFLDLSENAKLFVQGLNRSLVVEGEAEIEAFLAYKEVIVGYLQTFIVALSRYAPQITGLIAQVEDRGIAGLLPRIADMEAPPQRGRSHEEIVAREVARMEGQWVGLRSWFYETAERPAVTQTLQERASDAVNQILLTIRQINDQRFRKVDRAADLVAMASWFDQMDDALREDVAGLWRAAFGLHGARHLGVLRPLEDDEDVLEQVSWWDGRPAPISAAYRATGPRTRPGPVPRVRRSRRAKSMLAAQQGRQQQEETNAERSLAARSPVRLSALGTLSEAEAEVLLRCLDTALSVRPDRTGTHRAQTSDGRLLVVLLPVGGQRGEGGIAAVGLRGGRVSMEDMELTLHLRGEAM